MAMRMKELTRPGRCPTHGEVSAVKEVPEFTPPGLFWAFKRIGAMAAPYRCPQCGAKAS
jgi:hypothetical protein